VLRESSIWVEVWRQDSSLSYKTMFDSEYLLEFQWHPTSYIPINQKLRLVRRGYAVSAQVKQG
jgi:hypothetical protein